MSKSLRLSEKWFRRGLWLVAFLFAWFLIGLGGTIVGDLPQVESPLMLDDFLDKGAATQLRDTVQQSSTAQDKAQAELEQTRNSFKRQLLAASSEPRAELARINGRLQIAYAELDRLRMQLDGAVTAPHPDLPDGFAATQPMPQSMPPRR